jgi:hypothetical protein
MPQNIQPLINQSQDTPMNFLKENTLNTSSKDEST